MKGEELGRGVIKSAFALDRELGRGLLAYGKGIGQ